VVYVLDQASKAWALAALTNAPPQDLLGAFLRLYLVRNPGAAFSVGTGSTWLLTILAVVVLVVLIRASRRLGSMAWAWAFGLILGGALGNLTDRLIRDPGFGRGHGDFTTTTAGSSATSPTSPRRGRSWIGLFACEASAWMDAGTARRIW
jgi:lipoprotein signal peptidase